MANIKKVVSSLLTRSGTFIADVPDTPTIGTATDVGTSRAFNNGAATVTVNPTTGGIPTSYTVTSSPGSYSATGSSPVTVTGLQSNVSYTFTATATGGGYTTGSTSASNSITATTVPGAPTITSAVNVGTNRPYNNGAANIYFSAPANNGGKTITSYTVTSSGPTVTTATGSSSPITITGLNVGTYTFTITATNANGTSQPSGSSSSIAITTVPAAPTTATVYNQSDGTQKIYVAISDGLSGGIQTTNASATSTSGGLSGSASFFGLQFYGTTTYVYVTGQSIATAYQYNVTVSNANGSSASISTTSLKTVQWYGLASQFNAGSTTSTRQDLITLSSLPTSNNYCLFWSGIVAGNSVSYDVLSSAIFSPSNGSPVSLVNSYNMEPQDTTDTMATGGVYSYTANSNTSNLALTLGSENTAATATSNTYQAFLLRLTSNSAFSSITALNSVATTGATFLNTATVVSASAPSAGDYLVIASASVNLNSTTTTSSQIYVSTGSTTYGINAPLTTTDITSYYPYFHIEKVTATSGQTFSIKIDSGSSIIATAKGASITLLYLADYPNHFYWNPGTSPTTTSTTEVSAASTTFTTSRFTNHLLLGTSQVSGSSTAYQSNLVPVSGINSVTNYLHSREQNAANEDYPMLYMNIVEPNSSTLQETFGYNFYSENAANTVTAKEMRGFLLDLGEEPGGFFPI